MTRSCRNSESAKDDFNVNINLESATEPVDSGIDGNRNVIPIFPPMGVIWNRNTFTYRLVRPQRHTRCYTHTGSFAYSFSFSFRLIDRMIVAR